MGTADGASAFDRVRGIALFRAGSDVLTMVSDQFAGISDQLIFDFQALLHSSMPDHFILKNAPVTRCIPDGHIQLLRRPS